MPVNNPLMDVLQNKSLLDLGAGAPVVKVTGNVGVLNILFDNPVYTKRFLRMSLRPETAFGCAVNFLFSPTVAVRQYFEHEFRLMSSAVFKIGIQVRLGDGYLKGGTDVKYAGASLQDVKQFFDCAQYLTDMYKRLYQDPFGFWRQIRQKYGNKQVKDMVPGCTLN